MGKQSRERLLAPTEVKSTQDFIKTSPQKLNLLATMIRGKSAGEASAMLQFSKRRVAGEVRKVLMSAIANAENNNNLDADSLFVKEAYVGKSLVLKRFRPRARGRVGKILKPFSQITIVLHEVEKDAA